MKVMVSFKKLGTLSQETAIHYARNNGSFAIFIENTNWTPRMQDSVNRAMESSSQVAIPLAAFYDVMLRSMGVLLKFKLRDPLFGHLQLPVCGYTSVEMPFVQTLRYKNVRHDDVVYYLTSGTMNLSRIFERKEFYWSITGGPEACM
jgi:hypothetical protein